MSNKKTDEIIENVSNAIESRQQIALDAIELIMWMNKKMSHMRFEMHKLGASPQPKLSHSVTSSA